MTDTWSAGVQSWLRQWHTCTWYCQDPVHADIFLSIAPNVTVADFQGAVTKSGFPMQLREIRPAPEVALVALRHEGKYWCDRHQQPTAHCRCVLNAQYAWLALFTIGGS